MLTIGSRTFQIVTLDFETYYADDYTLSGKANMSEYIRDDRFHAHGVGIKINDGKTLWYTGENIRLALREIDWAKTALLGHNTMFDGFICSDLFGIKPAFYLDTLSMGRAAESHHLKHDLNSMALRHGLGGKVKQASLKNTKNKMVLTKPELAGLGGYCVDDVDDTYALFGVLHPHIPDDELRLIDLTMRMFCDPVLLIDIPRVTDALNAEVGAKTAALLLTGVQVDELMSNEKFAKLLLKHNVRPPAKISPATQKLVYAFAKSDLEFQKLLEHDNPAVANLARARLKVRSTIGETRAVRFLEAGKDGKCLPVALNYAGAHTLRWSGGNRMNLQNLKRGGELRRSILAPPGHVVVVADSAQIEARVLAWIAKQAEIVNAFATGQDVYKLMASVIYNTPESAITKDQRFIGKICVLGLGYGMGWRKLQATLAQGTMGPPVSISETEACRIVKVYRTANSSICKFWKTMDLTISAMLVGTSGSVGPLVFGKGFIGLPNGLFLQYYGLHGEANVAHNDLVVTEASYITKYGRNKLYGGLLAENVVQALARCIIAEQMLTISEKYRVVTMTHDEIVAICPEKKAQKCLDFMLKVMSTPPDWAVGLPLAAEGGFAPEYSK